MSIITGSRVACQIIRKKLHFLLPMQPYLWSGCRWNFFCFAWLVEFTKCSQKISTHLLLLWRWFCLVSYSPVTPYLQGLHGFWKFVAVHQKSSFFRNLGSKLASDSTPERKIKYFIDYGTYTFGVPFLFPVVQKWTAFFIPQIERRKRKYE